MRVLVTGHQGYIGVVLTPMLAAAGHDVVGLDNGLFVDGTLGDPPTEPEALPIDVRDIQREHLEGFDAVIHLAGISNDPLGDLSPDSTYAINHAASVRLAELARRAGVGRLLFASSCSMYGAGSPTDTLDESAPFNPVTPYAKSKVLVEEQVAALADEHFSPVFLRCATAYGYSARLRADLVVNNLTAYAFTQGDVLLKSDGTPWRPLVHIEDISRAYLVLLEAPRDAVHNEAFNVGRSSENYQIRDVAEIIERVVPNSRMKLAEDAGPDTRCYLVDCRKLEERFPEYKPQWTVERGAKQLLGAYREFGASAERLFGPEHIRLRQIQRLQQAGKLDETLHRV